MQWNSMNEKSEEETIKKLLRDYFTLFNSDNEMEKISSETLFVSFFCAISSKKYHAQVNNKLFHMEEVEHFYDE